MTDLKIHVDRDSVAAGDDVEQHKKTVSVRHSTDMLVMLSHLLVKYPLPQIAGGKATWIISRTSKFGTRFPYDAIAVMAQQWNLPNLLASPDTAAHLDADGSMTLYFKYMAQKSPDDVMSALKVLER
ncbi:MAG: hypothetical protein CMK07_09640 [Ponticaulis sp.]|nr:hypothetical protein [Ponticaulis sp.]